MKQHVVFLIKLSSLSLFAFLCGNLFSQANYNSHWHFGQGIGVDFTGGSPVNSPSNADTPLNSETGVLSDYFGNLLAYTDGVSVYNSDGDVLDNGVFDATASESIFSPIPEDPNRFYLFRSSASLGVTWSIIDISASAGLGGIDDAEKEIGFHDFNSQLMVTSNANQTDFWLVIADNNNGSGGEIHINSYEITSVGFNIISSYADDYIFATWDPYIDDARMSPSCTKIITIHKGHYYTHFDFDNSTGDITVGFTTSFDVSSSFITQDFIEFTSSGDFIFVLKDNSTLFRYDATTLNTVDFGISGIQINLPSDGDWNHIKLGPDGNIYLLNENENTLDVIWDSEELSPTYEAGVLILEGDGAKFFPNTMNSCAGVSYINVTDVCISDSTLFLASLTVEADSSYWVINGDDYTDTIYSATYFNELYLEPNVFEISFNYLYDDLWYILETTAIVYAQPTVNLGDDIVACAGDTIEIFVGETPYDLMWNTGSTENSILPENSGIYSVTLVNGACNAFDDIDVFFIQQPNFNIEDIVICDEQIDVTLDATGTWIEDYSWSDGSTDSLLTVSENGLYSVTASNECFSITDDALVTYVIFPSSLVDSSFVLCGTDTLELQSAYLGGNISWTNGDFGPFATFYDAGDYNITVEELGCFAFDSFTIEELKYVDVNNLLIPNIITVNKDNFNDVFRPFVPYDKTENICLYETLKSDMLIFNRWGNELYKGDCLWDGIIDNGNEVNEGTYYYLIDASSQCLELNSAKKFNGTVQVVK